MKQKLLQNKKNTNKKTLIRKFVLNTEIFPPKNNMNNSEK